VARHFFRWKKIEKTGREGIGPKPVLKAVGGTGVVWPQKNTKDLATDDLRKSNTRTHRAFRFFNEKRIF
jgi:hypothetical protein